MKTPFTQAELKALVLYDSSSGVFTWRYARWGRAAGERAGKRRRDGYVVLTLKQHSVLAHRAAWLYVTGEWPAHEIDHVDRNPSNNAFSNLREVTHEENLNNLGVRENNTSGVRGVSWDREREMWRAMYRGNLLGRTPNFEKACEMVEHARKPLKVVL